MRFAMVVLLFSALLASAQTRPVKSKALRQCESDLTAKTTAVELCLVDRHAYEMTIAQRDATIKELETKLTDITKRYEDAVFVLNDIHNGLVGYAPSPNHAARVSTIKDPLILDAAGKIFSDLNNLNGAVGSLIKHDAMAVETYNGLLANYNQLAQAWQQQNSRQQRFNNALAMYSLMPKYQPPQTINLQVSNCTALPALCVH